MRLGDYADAIRRSVTARQVADMLGLQPDKAGFCKCPLHGEKTGSMKLYPGNRGWYCFGCHQGGSVIDLVMAYNGLDLKGAIELINSEFNLGLPIGMAPTREQEEQAKRRAAERDAEKARREAIREEQNRAFLRWCDIGVEIAKLEHDKTDYAPKTMDEEWDQRFIHAINQIPILKDEAEDLAVRCFWKEDSDG